MMVSKRNLLFQGAIFRLNFGRVIPTEFSNRTDPWVERTERHPNLKSSIVNLRNPMGSVGWDSVPIQFFIDSHWIHGTGIFTYIYHKNQRNVGKYTSPMDPLGLIVGLGRLVVWIVLGSPKRKGIVTFSGTRFESQTTGPQTSNH